MQAQCRDGDGLRYVVEDEIEGYIVMMVSGAEGIGRTGLP